MAETVIKTERLRKQYNGVVAVESLDLAVTEGEVYGLLGPNGSGKTTTILMLLGLTEPTSGQVRILGFDPVRRPLSVKARVGYLPDQVGFYDNLTARENLIYIAKLNGLPRAEAYQRIDQALERMGLSQVANRPVGTFSHGMRQRLGIAEVLLKRPQIIIMDEPTLGLDPEAARLLLEIIQDLKAEGMTILLSSHLLHQVQAVCDRVGLFHRGRLVLEGSVSQLAQRVLGGAYRIKLRADGEQHCLQQVLERLPGVVRLQHQPPDRYLLEATADLSAEAAAALVNTGGRLMALTMEEPSLDDIYAHTFQEVGNGKAA